MLSRTYFLVETPDTSMSLNGLRTGSVIDARIGRREM